MGSWLRPLANTVVCLVLSASSRIAVSYTGIREDTPENVPEFMWQGSRFLVGSTSSREFAKWLDKGCQVTQLRPSSPQFRVCNHGNYGAPRPNRGSQASLGFLLSKQRHSGRGLEQTSWLGAQAWRLASHLENLKLFERAR